MEQGEELKQDLASSLPAAPVLPAAGNDAPSSASSLLLPAPSDTLHKFLGTDMVLTRYADTTALYRKYVAELHAARERVQKFIMRSHPPNLSTFASLPRSMNLDLLKNARFEEVTGEPNFYKEQKDALYKIQTETANKVCEILTKAKQAHVTHLEKRVNAQTFLTTQVPLYEQFVNKYAARYNTQYNLATADPSAFPTKLALDHFRAFLMELIQQTVMNSVAEGLKEDELAEEKAEQSRANQELVIGGANNGKTIAMIADARVAKGLEPISAMLQQIDIRLAKQAEKNKHKDIKLADSVNRDVRTFTEQKRNQNWKPSHSSNSSSASASSSSHASESNEKSNGKQRRGFKRAWPNDRSNAAEQGKSKEDQNKKARPSSFNPNSNALKPASFRPQAKNERGSFKRRLNQDERDREEDRRPASSSLKKARHDPSASSSSSPSASAPPASENPKKFQGGDSAAAASKGKASMVQNPKNGNKNHQARPQQEREKGQDESEGSSSQ